MFHKALVMLEQFNMLLVINTIIAFSQTEKIKTEDLNSSSYSLIRDQKPYFLFGKSLEGIITYSILPTDQVRTFIPYPPEAYQDGCAYAAACWIALCRGLKIQLSSCSHSPSRGGSAGHHEKDLLWITAERRIQEYLALSIL